METWLSAPGWTTAHIPRDVGKPRPVTVCGRVMRHPFPAGLSVARCHYCATVGAPPDRTEVFERGARMRPATR
jgi:hypothetical protein